MGNDKKELVQLFERVKKRHDLCQSNMTDGARRWSRNRVKCLEGIRKCIQDCHGGMEEPFFELPGMFSVSNYQVNVGKSERTLAERA
jgi:hypothetical protein